MAAQQHPFLGDRLELARCNHLLFSYIKKSYELVATKCGADSKNAVDFCKGISDNFSCKYFKTDAINKENVEEPFTYLATDIINQTGK